MPTRTVLKRIAPPLALAAAVLAFYARALDRPFTSEDFLLIRFLSENPPWRDLWSQLTSPWLGISVVKFYRPVSTLLYGAEIALFGGQPLGYNMVHVAIHATNAVLVWAIVRKLLQPGGARTALAAALLFAVYPLHPNAVIFSASFATIFGVAFFLAAVLTYQGFRESGSPGAWVASMAFFLLALGSYEETAVLPGLLVAYDHLVAGARRRHASLPLGYLPFFGVLGLYLLFRRSLFGVFIGGYDAYSQKLLAPQLLQMAREAATSVHQLYFPVYDRPPAPWAVAVSCLLLIGVPIVLWLSRRLDAGHARLWLFAWAWTLAAQAPFAFQPSVPGNGRYLYLAAAGAAMSLCFLARAVFALVPLPWRRLAPAAVGLLGVFWSVLLAGYVGDYVEAGRTARTIQGELLRVPAKGPIFFTRYPYFLLNGAQVPIAQIYHYGVWDSVHPPFVRERVPVYPLPPLAGVELLPVTRGAVYEWTGRLQPYAFAGPRPVEFQVLQPGDGAAVDPARDMAEVAVPPGVHARFRLILSTRINGAVFDLDPSAVQGGVLRADLPDEILQTSDRLYGKGVHYWWIEARDASGQVSGFSRMHGFRLSD